MFYSLEKGISDIKNNKFLAVSTITTISFAALIISIFMLIFVNTRGLMNSLRQNLTIMVYLKPAADLLKVKYQISEIKGIETITSISKEDALNSLKTKMTEYASLFESLDKNPLPDAYRVTVSSEYSAGEIKNIAEKIKNISGIDDVQYPQKWIEKFTGIFFLLKLAGIAIGSIFFTASIFFAANTIRLILYARREEIEIMRLIGAKDNFITTPFYIQSLIYGILGGIAGIIITYISFKTIPANILRDFLPDAFSINFLDTNILAAIIFQSVFAGWLGCFISLKQFLKI